jgi:hypothetical protein
MAEQANLAGADALKKMKQIADGQTAMLQGHAAVIRDRAKIEELWKPVAKNWFPEGKDDPKLLLIAVKPTSGNYWDTKNTRVVQLLKMAVGTVTGKPMDDGVQVHSKRRCQDPRSALRAPDYHGLSTSFTP